jgi:hypothetical protein
MAAARADAGVTRCNGLSMGPVRRLVVLAAAAVAAACCASQASADRALWSRSGARRAYERLPTPVDGLGADDPRQDPLLVLLIVVAALRRHRIGSAKRLSPRVSALAVLALVVGGVAALTTLRLGRDANAEPLAVTAAGLAAAPAPPTGSVTFARESGALAVALSVRPVEPLRLVATIIGPSGRGLDGLDVELRAANAGRRTSSPTRPCGHGCYAASLRVSQPGVFEVDIGNTREVAFPVAGAWPPPPGTAFLRRATSAFRGLRSAVYLEHLASRPGNAIETAWRIKAPNRLAYEIRGGADGIVIGGTRWDRPVPGAEWRRSTTTPLEQPFPPWGMRAVDARVLRETAGSVTLSWLDPGVPAWFIGTFDRTTALPRELRMTASAHFMRHRYIAFNRSVEIEPPMTSVHGRSGRE